MAAAGDAPLALDSFFAAGPDEAVRAVVDRAHSGHGGYACLANVHVVVTATRDEQLSSALQQAWMVFPDGWPVAWLQRRLGHAKASRVAGPDLMPRVVESGQRTGLRHFLFGSTEEVVSQLGAELQSRYPSAQIVGSLAPPYGAQLSSDDVLNTITSARPHVVWCALGAPKQELWMQSNAQELEPALILGVGAAFDFVARTKSRAPHWVQRLGLEWLHRLATEPRRLFGRYARTNAAFVALSAREILGRRR